MTNTEKILKELFLYYGTKEENFHLENGKLVFNKDDVLKEKQEKLLNFTNNAEWSKKFHQEYYEEKLNSKWKYEFEHRLNMIYEVNRNTRQFHQENLFLLILYFYFKKYEANYIIKYSDIKDWNKDEAIFIRDTIIDNKNNVVIFLENYCFILNNLSTERENILKEKYKDDYQKLNDKNTFDFDKVFEFYYDSWEAKEASDNSAIHYKRRFQDILENRYSQFIGFIGMESKFGTAFESFVDSCYSVMAYQDYSICRFDNKMIEEQFKKLF